MNHKIKREAELAAIELELARRRNCHLFACDLREHENHLQFWYFLYKRRNSAMSTLDFISDMHYTLADIEQIKRRKLEMLT